MLVRSRLTAPGEALLRAATDVERLAIRRLDEQRDRLTGAALEVDAAALRVLRTAGEGVAQAAGALPPAARRVLDGSGARMATSAALLGAYDPARQLGRGWTLTRTPEGRIVRRAADLSAGDELVTAFADGTARSRVLATDIGSSEEDAAQ